MSMGTNLADTIDLEDVALRLLRELQLIMPTNPHQRFAVDELDAEQEPGMTIEILEKYAKRYRPYLPEDYKRVIEEEFGYTF